jgi:hypothetical protein
VSGGSRSRTTFGCVGVPIGGSPFPVETGRHTGGTTQRRVSGRGRRG